jgi:hypothetical protein
VTACAPSLWPARHFIVALALGLAALATGCGGDDNDNAAGYPAAVREEFFDGCTGEGAEESQCKCMWDEITDRYTYAEYQDLENDLDGEGGEKVIEAIQDCLGL